MTGDTYKRPWLAAVLAVVYPGLGHVYLRAWVRALLWFGAVVLTATLFIPESALTGVSTPGDLVGVAESMPLEAMIALPVVGAFNVIDAYLTAKRGNATVTGVRCTSCGREVDEDLSFCHWCTASLSPDQG